MIRKNVMEIKNCHEASQLCHTSIIISSGARRILFCPVVYIKKKSIEVRGLVHPPIARVFLPLSETHCCDESAVYAHTGGLGGKKLVQVKLQQAPGLSRAHTPPEGTQGTHTPSLQIPEQQSAEVVHTSLSLG